MLSPSIDDLLKQVGSQFTVVTLVTKRAHQLNNKAPSLVNVPLRTKAVSTALEEIVAGKIKPKPIKDKSNFHGK